VKATKPGGNRQEYERRVTPGDCSWLNYIPVGLWTESRFCFLGRLFLEHTLLQIRVYAFVETFEILTNICAGKQLNKKLFKHLPKL